MSPMERESKLEINNEPEMFRNKEPKTQRRCSRRLLFICPLLCSVFSRMNQRDTSFSPSSSQPSSLCVARNQAEPRGSKFDCCLSWLSLSAPAAGTRLGPPRISSPQPLFLQHTFTPHLSSQVFCCPFYFLF